ncbi:helix-turn-helix transcriptional regulator [Streptomyces sp. NPDC005485]|uniref:helix-turn-helix domain-containing protein n=1 Tax=Streptomyces sp. NPDC005485 TaxID=3155591 RepID=UPI0033AAFD4A
MSSLWNTGRDAGDGGTVAGDEFAGLLRELKERSGLSYGALGKRLHMSTSTLHRYANGDAVPTDYAPVERFARACRATPEELVELHRRWVLADAVRRGQKGAAAALAAGGAGAVEAAEVSRAAEVSEAVEPAPETVSPEVREVREGGAGADAEAGVWRRRRAVMLAGAGVVAAAVAAVLVVNLVPGKGKDHGEKQSLGAPASTVAERTGAGATASPDARPKSPSPSASRSPRTTPSVSARTTGAAAAPSSAGPADDGAAAPAVATNPYKWEEPCSQHYLVNREPEKVPPPPNESDARGWVAALGGVAGGQQMVALTVQGTGKATVVLDALHVRVVDKEAPLAWNDYTMGVGCGGGVKTASFHVDLDAGRPATEPRAGQRDFPYKVSESDPEVFYVFADVQAHNVSWYLELDWSSGRKSGTVRVDDRGKPFRTSGNVGRPAYDQPLGDSEWGPVAPQG